MTIITGIAVIYLWSTLGFFVALIIAAAVVGFMESRRERLSEHAGVGPWGGSLSEINEEHSRERGLKSTAAPYTWYQHAYSVVSFVAVVGVCISTLLSAREVSDWSVALAGIQATGSWTSLGFQLLLIGTLVAWWLFPDLYKNQELLESELVSGWAVRTIDRIFEAWSYLSIPLLPISVILVWIGN